MKPTVFTPRLIMSPTMTSAICWSFCGVLKTQRLLASTGSTMRLDAAIETIGVSVSAATSIIASEFGVIVEPTITSTLSSVISLRAFLTAVVVSDASSSTMYCTFLPPIVCGISAKVLRSGMPSDAAGPVADNVDADLDVLRECSADTDGGQEDRQQLGGELHVSPLMGRTVAPAERRPIRRGGEANKNKFRPFQQAGRCPARRRCTSSPPRSGHRWPQAGVQPSARCARPRHRAGDRARWRRRSD